MKTLSAISRNILSFTLACLFTISCQQNSKHSEIREVIPELIERNEKIQLGKEWDFVQNFYAAQIKTLKANSGDLESRLQLAELFVKEARVTGEHGYYYPAALNMTNQILENKNLAKDLQFRTLMTKAGVQLSLHEFEYALETGKKAITLNAKNAQAHGILVDAYVELGEYKKAVASADRMVKIKPDIRSYSRVSYLREIYGDYDGAIDAMTLAAKAGYPGYEETAWAMQTLGELYMLYGEEDKAEKVFESILVERDNYPFAIAALGALKLQNNLISTAELITKQAISIIPEVSFYTQLAEIYKAQEREEELEEIMNDIFLMLEDDVTHGHNMNLEYAHIYLNLLENKEKALEYALLEYEKRPKNIDVNILLAKIYESQGAIDKTHEHIEAASITNSQHPQLEELKNHAFYKAQISSI